MGNRLNFWNALHPTGLHHNIEQYCDIGKTAIVQDVRLPTPNHHATACRQPLANVLWEDSLIAMRELQDAIAGIFLPADGSSSARPAASAGSCEEAACARAHVLWRPIAWLSHVSLFRHDCDTFTLTLAVD